ncbi:MAG: hypothetical protein RLZZ347_571 [Candidatus Parcubacteria bacterium]|jgi:DNA polymerase III delta subunit
MIYLLYGEDTVSARAKAHELIAVLQKKKPNASFFTMMAEHCDASRLQEFAGGQGLFEQKYIVFLDRVLETAEAKEAFLDCVKAISESDNIFVMLEGKLDKATLTKIEKKAEKVQEFVFSAGAKVASKSAAGDRPATIPEFNIFVLSDALGKKDKKSLWVFYQKALLSDTPPEEISGTLFWQVKSMLTARVSNTALESGLNPFVFQKSKAYEKNYPGDSLRELSEKLVSIYHDAHRGKGDFAIALERLILSL